MLLFCFFFKQKTAYDVRISVWSSDVCSSELKFHDITSFDHVDALGDLAFQVDRLDLAAVLLALEPLLRALVVVQLALDPLAVAVEDVDHTPENVVEIGLDPGVG